MIRRTSRRAKAETAAKFAELHEEETVLADGRKISNGDEFTLIGGGRYVFRYRYTSDGSLSCHGPIGSPRAKLRAFHEDRVRTIHRSKEARP